MRCAATAVPACVKAGTITSSPGTMPSASMARLSASVPELTPIANGAPRKRANSVSKASHSAPRMYRPPATTLAIAAPISSRCRATRNPGAACGTKLGFAPSPAGSSSAITGAWLRHRVRDEIFATHRRARWRRKRSGRAATKYLSAQPRPCFVTTTACRRTAARFVWSRRHLPVRIVRKTSQVVACSPRAASLGTCETT